MAEDELGKSSETTPLLEPTSTPASPIFEEVQVDETVRDLYKAIRHEVEGEPKELMRAQSWGPDHFLSVESASDICQPGGFRRHFLRQKAEAEGLEPPSAWEVPLVGFILQSAAVGADTYVGLLGHGVWDYLGDFEGRRRILHKASPTVVFFATIKTFIGTGLLFIPHSFHQAGLAVAATTLTLVGLLSTYCMTLLLDIRDKYSGVDSISEIGELALGAWGKIFVEVSVTVSQAGFCCSYLIFISEHVQEALVRYADWDVSQVSIIMIACCMLVPLIWIRRVQSFAFIALLGTFCAFFVVGLICVYAATNIAHNHGVHHVKSYNSDWLLFLGTAIYTYEGVGLVLPLEDSINDREKFRPVLYSAMTFIVGLLVSFGTLNYLSFGDEVEAPVTLSLPQGSPVVQVVQLTFCVALLFTFPLMFFPVVKITEAYFFSHRSRTIADKWKKNIFRIVLVGVSGIIAVGGSQAFDHFIALIGGLCCVPLGFIFPTLFHYQLMTEASQLSRWFDILVIVVGSVTMVFCTYMAILTWND